MAEFNTTPSRNTWFERNPKKTLAFIIIIGFIVLDFGAAAVLKALGLFEPSYTTSKILEAHYRKQHPVFHHTLKANIDYDKAEWGRKFYTVHTNSLGFKDSRVREISLANTKKRILFIGDSFTEGVGFEYKDTFIGLLDKELQQNNVEVLNAAATSYSPIIYLRKVEYLLQTVGLKFDRLVVLIDLSDMADEALGYQFDPQRNVVSRSTIENVGVTTQPKKAKLRKEDKPFSAKEFFTNNTIILGRSRNLAGYLRNKLRPWDKSLNRQRGRWTMDEKLYKEYGQQGLSLAKQHMNELKTLLDTHNISLTVAVYPWPDQIYYRDLNSKQVTFWQDWTDKHNANFINLFPTFINETDAQDIITRYFINGDIHWNKQGHALMANSLLKQLKY